MVTTITVLIHTASLLILLVVDAAYLLSESTAKVTYSPTFQVTYLLLLFHPSNLR